MQLTAERLRQLRERAGLRQSEAAAALGVTPAAYRNYETGRRDMPSAILRNAGVFYRVSLDYITGITDVPRVPDIANDEAVKAYYSLVREDRVKIQERIRTLMEERAAYSPGEREGQ